jgi:hypothetical protein
MLNIKQSQTPSVTSQTLLNTKQKIYEKTINVFFRAPPHVQRRICPNGKSSDHPQQRRSCRIFCGHLCKR